MDALDAYDAIPAAAVEAACLSYESAAIAEGYEPVSSRGTYQMRAWMTAALTAALPHLSAARGVVEAWQQGYHQGVQDERTSEANIGIAGFGAKVEPARINPYLTQQPAPQSAPVGVEAVPGFNMDDMALCEAGVWSLQESDSHVQECQAVAISKLIQFVYAALAQQPAADEEAAEQYRKGWEAGHAADQHPAAVDGAGKALAEQVGSVAALLVGYGDTAEFAAAKLRDALREYDAAQPGGSDNDC